ncbi:hypothetical protein [Vibrio vulnificus]|uniref:hypothetical protein n=1 Tax=Vibrio vulnificus TaxID=672 RepID=UPI003ED9B808
MAKLNTEVIVKELPEMVISMPASTDWVAVGSIVVTALVVIGTTYLTVKNLNKTIQLQKDLAEQRNELDFKQSTAERISTSRQDWINNVRDIIAEYTGIIQKFDNHSKVKNAKLKQFERFSSEQGTRMSQDLFNTSANFQSEAWACRTKINLYLNPNEQLSKDIMKEIDTLYEIAGEELIPEEGHQHFWETLTRLEEFTQKLLKSEWDRVKQQI